MTNNLTEKPFVLHGIFKAHEIAERGRPNVRGWFDPANPWWSRTVVLRSWLGGAAIQNSKCPTLGGAGFKGSLPPSSYLGLHPTVVGSCLATYCQDQDPFFLTEMLEPPFSPAGGWPFSATKGRSSSPPPTPRSWCHCKDSVIVTALARSASAMQVQYRTTPAMAIRTPRLEPHDTIDTHTHPLAATPSVVATGTLPV